MRRWLLGNSGPKSLFVVDFFGVEFILEFHLFREGNQVVSGEGCLLRRNLDGIVLTRGRSRGK